MTVSNKNGKVYYDINSSYEFFLELSKYCPDDIKILLIDPKQLKILTEDDYNRNGTDPLEIDGLTNVRTQKYIKKLDKGSTTEVTWLDNIIEPKNKYSKYIEDLVVDILSIQEMSYEKVSEIIKLTKNVDISRERVCEIYLKHTPWRIYDDLKKIQEDIRTGKIELSGVIHYDEQIVWVKHQKYFRLTIIDANCRVILQDIVVPARNFNKKFIEKFLTESIEEFEIDTIVTDGYRAYQEIIDNLGIKQHRCSFHAMKNLMDDISPIHNKLRNDIKNLERDIRKLKEEINELKEKGKGKVGRPKDTDLKRKKEIADRREKEDLLAVKKEELKKYRTELEEDEKIIKKISRIFKYKSLTTAKNKFNELYENRDQYREEIANFLKRLSKYIDVALNHVLDDGIPSTNNTIEGFFKITLPRCNKRKFMTYEGLINRILLSDVRYMKRNIIYAI